MSRSANIMLHFNTLTTPQAPWTPNWIQNAPAARPENEEGMIHTGIKTTEMILSVNIHATKNKTEPYPR